MFKNILLIDNYDSFTFNVKHLIESSGDVSLTVLRNDDPLIMKGVRAGIYHGVVIGPGPGSPEDAPYFGHNKEVILNYGTNGLPILGICLGFQGIFHLFGGKLKLGIQPVHGKVSKLSITKESPLFHNVANFTPVMRYHSIFADTLSGIPTCINVTAYTHNACHGGDNLDEPMALEHSIHPIFGVQFHPESFATPSGRQIVANFLGICPHN